METPSGATTETTGSPSGDSANPGAESPPAANTGEKQRIDELTGNWRDSQRNVEHFRNRTTELERENAALRAGKPGATEQRTDDDEAGDEDVKTLADFKYDEKAYGKYIRNLARTEAGREADKIRSELKGERTAAEKNEALGAFQEKATNWATTQKLEKIELMYASPAEGGPYVSDHMGEAIMTSDHGPEILNYLTRNRAESKRIHSLSLAQQGREIGKLEAKFATSPEQKTVSGAPPPHEQVKGASDTSVKTDPAKQTDSEWWASKQRSDRAKAAARK